MSNEIVIPESMPVTDFYSIDGIKLRREYVEQGMYAFVSWKWVKPFAKWINGRKCLEVLSGRGWLSYALRQLNVDIIATDDMSWSERGNFHGAPITDIERLDAIKAIKTYGKDVDIVIMSWPPYQEDIAYQILKTLHEVNPNAILIYIGERYGGCTADDEFFENAEFVEDDEFREVSEEFEQWDGIHDELYIVKYEEEEK